MGYHRRKIGGKQAENRLNFTQNRRFVLPGITSQVGWRPLKGAHNIYRFAGLSSAQYRNITTHGKFIVLGVLFIVLDVLFIVLDLPFIVLDILFIVLDVVFIV